MVRFLVAIVVGAVLAGGAAITTRNVLAGIANGQPVTKTLYNYGTR